MNMIERMQAPTPPFFIKVRTIGLALAAISAVVITSPLAMPPLLLTIAGYMGVAGAVATAVSQATTGTESEGDLYDDGF